MTAVAPLLASLFPLSAHPSGARHRCTESEARGAESGGWAGSVTDRLTQRVKQRS